MRYGSTDLLAETRCLFAPIPCTGGSPEPEDVRSYLDEHHEQLWTEAVKRVRALHETAYLPDTLKAAQAELTEQFRAVDEVAEDVIGKWLDANPARRSPRTRSPAASTGPPTAGASTASRPS